ncbi:MAG: class II SORL domain-containing protein [Lentisphaeria bacterium]|nr:class II SORL domain-containing protein [Lentisphaeria bacterium]
MSNEFWKMNLPVEATDKHTPIIKLVGNVVPGEVIDVVVDVSTLGHPNDNAHHIQWVELRANNLFIARAEFTPRITLPIVTFKVVVPREGVLELTAIERCNLHGLWVSEPVTLG